MEDYLPKRRRILDYIELLLAAAGMWAAFPDMSYWFLVFPAIMLLVSVLDRVKAGRATWYGFVFGLAFFLPHIWWATVSVGSYLPWFALAFVQALFLAVFGWSVALVRQIDVIRRSPLLYSLAITVLWVGVEQLRGHFPFTGFPWGYLAYSQVNSPLGQLAPWGSEVVIGLVVVCSSVLVRRAFSLVPAHGGRWVARPIGVLLAGLMVAAPLGITLDARAEAGTLRVGLIQGNVELPANATFSQYLKVTQNHVDETLKALEDGMDVDVILWGENSMDRDPRVDAKARALIESTVREAGVPIVVGVVRYEDDARWNEAIVWYPDGAGDIYTKQLPVPFGEYIPYREFLSVLSKETAKVSVDMLPGDKPGIMRLALPDRDVNMGVGICFEAAYEHVFAEAVDLGAQFLMVPTNNSSFGYTPESTQQLQMVQLRAMSLSRTALQVSTNGVSAVVRPNGTIQRITGLYEPAWTEETIPLRNTVTFSAHYGQYLNYAAMGGAGLLFLIGLVRTIQTRARIRYAQ